jgi:cell division transport system ATP-binding protein
MIVLNDISKSYGKKPVFKNLSLIIKKGELTFLTGPSGAGKSTLLKLIFCSERPDSGHISVADWEVSKLKQKAIPELRRHIGIVFQDFRLLQNKTVYENVALPLEFIGMHPQKIRGLVNELLEKVNLIHTASAFPQFLSGGEQQRVVIARAVITKPIVLLTDEPTGNLDAGNSKAVMDLFEDINNKGTTILLATHNTELYKGTGCRVLNINNQYIDKESIG